MPKLRATPEQKAMKRFNGFVLANMKSLKIRQQDIADCIGLQQPDISMRLTCKREWSLTEMYKVCELFGEPYQVGCKE